MALDPFINAVDDSGDDGGLTRTSSVEVAASATAAAVAAGPSEFAVGSRIGEGIRDGAPGGAFTTSPHSNWGGMTRVFRGSVVPRLLLELAKPLAHFSAAVCA